MLSNSLKLVVVVTVVGFIPARKHGALSLNIRKKRQIETFEQCCCLTVQRFEDLLIRIVIGYDGPGSGHIRFVLPPFS